MGASVQFLFLWHILYPFTYFLTSLVTLGYQKFLITNSVIFHCPLCFPTSISWYGQITSVLNFSSLGIYTFLSFNINPSSSCYSSSLRILTPTYFISSTAFVRATRVEQLQEKTQYIITLWDTLQLTSRRNLKE